MKKVIGIGLAIGLVVALASVAIAFGPGYGWGPGNCGWYNYQNVSPEEMTKLQQKIQPLQGKIWTERGELMTLMAQPTPDWKAVSEKEKEIVELNTEFQKAFTGYGITTYRGFGPGYGFGYGMGPRMGYGSGYRMGPGMGYGRGPGWMGRGPWF